MKKSLFILAVAAMTAGISCTDLSEVEGRLDSLESEVSVINATLKTIQDNLNNKVYVSKVEPSADGYTIHFTNGTTAVIKNGKDGAQGAQGEAGAPGAAGKDGDSLFASVETKDGFVYLTLSDGTVMVLPMAPAAVAQIKDLVFCPEYSDGKATIVCASPESASAKLCFTVVPTTAAAEIEKGIKADEITLSVAAEGLKTRANAQTALNVKEITFDGARMEIDVDASAAVALEGEVALQIALAMKDGADDFVSDKIPAVKDVRYIEYGGRTYGFAKMADGKVWMTENLSYIPEGMTPCNSTADVKAGVYYPVVVNEAGTAAAFGTAEDAKRQGYLYQSEVALGLSVDGITSEEQAKSLEGTRGICPEGWHIPTIADITGLVGKAVSPIATNTSAPYYNGTNGSILMLKEDGLDMMPCGAVTIQDNTKTSGTLMGFLKNYTTITSGYICGSSYAGVTYNTSGDAASGIKNIQFYGLMPMANKATEAEFTCNGSKLSYKVAASVRCVKD